MDLKLIYQWQESAGRRRARIKPLVEVCRILDKQLDLPVVSFDADAEVDITIPSAFVVWRPTMRTRHRHLSKEKYIIQFVN